jgi:hypothetical protein
MFVVHLLANHINELLARLFEKGLELSDKPTRFCESGRWRSHSIRSTALNLMVNDHISTDLCENRAGLQRQKISTLRNYVNGDDLNQDLMCARSLSGYTSKGLGGGGDLPDVTCLGEDKDEFTLFAFKIFGKHGLQKEVLLALSMIMVWRYPLITSINKNIKSQSILLSYTSDQHLHRWSASINRYMTASNTVFLPISTSEQENPTSVAAMFSSLNESLTSIRNTLVTVGMLILTKLL